MTDQKDQSADKLLWLAAGVIVLMGLAWLVVAAPWSNPDVEILEEIQAVTPEPQITSNEPSPAPVAASASNSDPLHMAQMALDAGMLIEPAEYSAWTLFGRVAASEPENEAARDGLALVAAALLQRGNSAFEQGRYEDAADIAAIIVERIPAFPGARELSDDVIRALTPPEPAPEPEPQRELVAEEPEPVDPIPDMSDAFQDAMAQNAVLRPAGTSAVDIVREMLSTAPDHELTIEAQELLVTEMLDRSEQSIEALDTRSAQTWIDSAALISSDQTRIARAQNRLTQHLIDNETQKLLPASELTQVHSAAPEFPRIPLERGIEGWVDVEFIVSTNGTAEDVTVIDSSHERFFREEAVAAVQEWRFEPFIFMDQAIPKRAYTRLAFVLD